MLLTVVIALVSVMVGLIAMRIAEKHQRDGMLVLLSTSSAVALRLLIIVAERRGLLTNILAGSFSRVCINLFYLLSIPIFVTIIMIYSLVHKDK